jgi:hypothetical protein
LEMAEMDLLELRNVQDTFVTGLGAVENIGGGNFRFTFFTSQDVHGRSELVVAAKLIMSIEAVPDAIQMAAKLTNLCACENVRKLARN